MSKRIPLSGKRGEGFFVIVDDCDYKRYKDKFINLDAHGYPKIAIGKEPHTLHRLVMDSPIGIFVDHVNHNLLDCRHSNLRLCTRAENNRNRRADIGTSKYKGVSWNKAAKKWRAQIRDGVKKIGLGYFDNEEAAAIAYDIAAIKCHKEFAYTNRKKD